MLEIDLRSKGFRRGFSVPRDLSNRISLTINQSACVDELLGPTEAKLPRLQGIGS